ncbi:lysozyme [Methylobacterium sp. NPDC080182]|uniref:lysozyme n=1 Tax=Methylobacterium sp. NPDC080182 TaxID=3390590 RepID=UPI003CFE5A13
MDRALYTVSRNGVLFIANREALVLTAYSDGPHPSIGFGSNSPALRVGDTITVPDAFRLLRKDIASREPGLNKRIRVPLEQHQYDALFSLHYQSGNRYMPVDPREAGDERPDILRLLNAGRLNDAAAAWPDCDANLAGQRQEGLRKRRILEQAVFLRGDYGQLDPLPYWPGDPRTTKRQAYHLRPEDLP